MKREAEEIKTSWSRSTSVPSGTGESNKASFIRVEGQTKTLEAFRQDFLNLESIGSASEDQHEVIGIANGKRCTFQSGKYVIHPPLVENLMEVDIRKEW